MAIARKALCACMRDRLEGQCTYDTVSTEKPSPTTFDLRACVLLPFELHQSILPLVDGNRDQRRPGLTLPDTA